MLEYITHSDRKSWLADRKIGIGASEAAAIYGVSRWNTPVGLWEEKTGKRRPKDLSGSEAVEEGNRVEGPMRELFGALHPEYILDYRPYDMLRQAERPWLYATLDGELTEIQTGKRGILEIKRHEIGGKSDWVEWDGRIPDHYYTQICHQFLATQFDFAFLWALLRFPSSGEIKLQDYYFLPADCQGDMEALLGQEERFWDCVQRKKRPGAKLTL